MPLPLTAWVVWLLLLTGSASQETLTSYEEILKKLQDSSGKETHLRLAARRRYSLADSLTLTGVPSITLEGPADANPDERPIITFSGSSPAIVANATLVRLANLQFEGCAVPAVVLYSPSDDASSSVDWSIQNVSFRSNGAVLGNLVITPTTSQWAAFTASCILVPELRGNLSLHGCSFLGNSGGFGKPYASPPVAIACSTDCSVSASDSVFTENSGTHASSLLLQTSGAARVRVTRARFFNNTASWISAPRYHQRFPLPPASVSYLALNSAPSAPAELEMQDVQLQRSISSHGLALLRLAPLAPAASDIRLRLQNVTLSDHFSGPAPLLAVGVRQAVLTGVTVASNIVPPADKLPANLINFSRGLLCSGSLACLALDAAPDSGISIDGSTLYNNTNLNTGALFVTTVPVVLANNATPVLGSLRVDGLRAVGQSSSTLGLALQVTSVSSVHFSSSEVSNNTVGGGLAIENADSVTMMNMTFAGNLRELLFDQLGEPLTAFGRGAGLWVVNSRSVYVRDCSFFGNRAFTGGAAALFSNIDSLELGGVHASNNEVFGSTNTTGNGGDGGAFLVSEATGVSLYDSEFRNNRAVRNGGALSLESFGDMRISSVLFDGNVAAFSGGAISLADSNRGTDVNRVENCTFVRNVALADTDSRLSSTASLSVGGGGAVSSRDVVNTVRFDGCTAVNNSAPFGSGGGLNVQSSAIIIFIRGTVVGNVAGVSGGGMYFSSMESVGSSYIIQSTLDANSAGTLAEGDGAVGLGGGIFVETSVLQLKCSELRRNVAKKGGGMYAHLQAQVAIVGTEDGPECPIRAFVPAVPRASQGSLATLLAPQGSSATPIDTNYSTVLANNTALSGGAVYIEDGILRVHVDLDFSPGNPGVLFANNTAATGGAVLAYSALEVSALADFYNNTATAAAAAHVALRLGLAKENVPVPEATGSGGALAVRGSDTTKLTAQDCAFVGNSAADGGAVYIGTSESCPAPAGCFTTRLAGCVLANNTARGGGGGGVFWEHLGLLNITCSTSTVRQLASALSPAAPPSNSGGADVVVGTGDDAGGGGGSSLPPYHRAPPPATLDVGMLACDSWSGNAAVDGAYGSDVASTEFTLDAVPHYLSFYTSSAPITVNLSVTDYYRQLCTGGNRSVVIRAVSPQVFAQTYMASSQGTAAFTDLKLRAKSGWQDIDFAASTAFRDLQASGMTVYVRPCVIGEYLSPTLDQCLQCSVGYYNFNHTANNCAECSNDAFCSDPNHPGMIVPHPGYWHSNFFSEQVADCPNAAACSYPNRTAALSAIQQQVLALAQRIQASLVHWPAAFHSQAPNAAANVTGTPRQLLVQAQLQRLRSLADEMLAASGISGVTGGRARRGFGAAVDTAPFRELRRQMAELQELSGGENPYGPSYDDDYYMGLLQAIDDLAANYKAGLCSNGYEGVLCGSCAPGYGSTGPSTCRPCPSPIVNNLYYALAMLLTLVILGWTIRSLLHQSLLAAHTARGERKAEVMDELRIMGRPVVNPSLIAVLDEDEMPDDRSQHPIFGHALPPDLEGLVALRAAYQQQTMESSRSFFEQQPPRQQQQHSLQERLQSYHHHQQQQPRAAGVMTAAAASLRTRPWSMHRLPVAVTPLQGAVAESQPDSSPGSQPSSQLRPRYTPMTPSGRYPGGDAMSTDGAVMSPPGAAALSPVLTSGGGGSAIVTLVAASPFTARSARTRPSLEEYGGAGGARGGGGGVRYHTSEVLFRGGDVRLVAARTDSEMYDSRRGTSVEDLAAAGDLTDRSRLESDGGGHGRYDPGQQQPLQVGQRTQQQVTAQEQQLMAVQEQQLMTVQEQQLMTVQEQQLMTVQEQQQVVRQQQSRWSELQGPLSPQVLLRQQQTVDGPPQAVAEAESDAAEPADDECDDGGAGEVDHDPRDSARDRQNRNVAMTASQTSLLQRGGGRTSRQVPPLPPPQLRRLKGPLPDEAAADGAATFAAETPVDRSRMRNVPRPQQQEQRRQQALPKNALEAILWQRGRRSSTGLLMESLSSYLYCSNGGSEGGMLVPPRTASASAGSVLRRPWFGAGGGVAAAAGMGAPPSAAGGAGGERAVQPFGGLHPSFPGRQTLTGGSTARSLRVASVSGLPAPFLAQVRRHQSRLETGRGTPRAAPLGGPIRLWRSVADDGADASIRAEIEALRSGSVSTVGSRVSLRSLGAVLRRRLGGAVDASGQGSIEIRHVGLVGTGSRGGGGLRWNEYGVEEFGPQDEEFGSAVSIGPGGCGGKREGGAGPAALAAPDDYDRGRGRDCPNTFRPESDANPLQDAATIKIFISYVQILALVKAVPIPNPPRSVSGYLRFYDQITAMPGGLVSLDCSLPDGFAVSKAMQRTILASMAPLYVSVGVAVVWLGIMLVSYAWERRSHPIRRPRLTAFARTYLPPRLVMSFTTVMFYFYPNSVRSLLSIFSCVSVDSPTDNKLAADAGLRLGRFWTLDYSEECYQGRHLALALGLGVSGLLLLGVGWPVGVAVWLYRKGREQALDFSDFSMVVYAAYRELYQLRFLYWESIIMLRQMAVAVVVVLLAQRGVAVQMLVVIAVVAAAFVAQLLVQPFRTKTMNRLEEVSLVVIMITLYLNLYLLSPAINVTGRTLLAVFIIGINATMLAVFVYYITRTSWDKQLDKMGLDRRRVYDMHPNEIRASLRRRYGRRTTELLTRVVTSAQTLVTAKSTIYHMAPSFKHGDKIAVEMAGGVAAADVTEKEASGRSEDQEQQDGAGGTAGSGGRASEAGNAQQTAEAETTPSDETGAACGDDGGRKSDQLAAREEGMPRVEMQLERRGSGRDS